MSGAGADGSRARSSATSRRGARWQDPVAGLFQRHPPAFSWSRAHDRGYTFLGDDELDLTQALRTETREQSLLKRVVNRRLVASESESD